MLDRLDETIVAISSAPGFGSVGIVRLSGPQAVSIVDLMCDLRTGRRLAETPASTRVSGEIRPDNELAMPASFYVFRSPHSYTRQNTVEIYLPGSPPALESVLRRAIEVGALSAEPGEFTARAFVNGALDLAEAEAVAGIIRARSDTQLHAARRIMEGDLSTSVAEQREELAELLALVEADIDFAEEPIEFITPAVLHERVSGVRARLRRLIQDSRPVERFDALPHILLFGGPNVGKSSLMNRLSGTSRAICAAAAGTTRDILSAPVRLGSCEAILLDTAGVDQSADEILAAARAMTISAARSVDLVCLVIDLSRPIDGHLPTVLTELDVDLTVVVGNKLDLLPTGEVSGLHEELSGWRLGPVYLVSALEGTGIAELRAVLAKSLNRSETTVLGEALLLTQRQRSAITEAAESLERVVGLSEESAGTMDHAELVAFELREALDALGTVAGAVVTEDLLGRVFASFCIGK